MTLAVAVDANLKILHDSEDLCRNTGALLELFRAHLGLFQIWRSPLVAVAAEFPL